MASILHIDSSPRGDRSKSRKLAKKFIDAWQDLHPDDVITYRDLRQTPVPHVTEDLIAVLLRQKHSRNGWTCFRYRMKLCSRSMCFQCAMYAQHSSSSVLFDQVLVMHIHEGRMPTANGKPVPVHHIAEVWRVSYEGWIVRNRARSCNHVTDRSVIHANV